ncbi:DUF2062 domain-containing protein [Sphingomicrobium lutaoense]|uniref:DUF2062 domain-containing protein n=1 Tax=Sphingomicrobium lutaoense TaxID=515949 RepID=A0A839YWR5_9SPHN|nr:DUF2062 domain-containing protein [Sphingomicrobium lutaoense]MBB3763629.1 hypothetical protein [Sphingomicrobium lutaoense]
MAEDKGNLFHRFIGRHAPSREEMLASRFLKPFGPRIRNSEYWRFTRRSVPRGVLAGMFIGVFLMIPGLQIIGATLLSLPMRANIPVAAAMTFLSNPFTTPFFLAAGLQVGSLFGFRADLAAFTELTEANASYREWASWAFSDAGPALIVGLFVIAVVLALVAYAVSLVGWRLWIGRKWNQRVARDTDEMNSGENV